MSHVLADAVLVVHLGFVLFVAFGGLAVLRFRALAWLHVPAVLWAGVVELAGLACPLTPLESWLRARAGLAPYSEDFLAHHLLLLIYPAGLTRPAQVALGVLALGGNAVVYGVLWLCHHRRREELRR